MTSSSLSSPRAARGDVLAGLRRLFARPNKKAEEAATDVAFLHCSDLGWNALVIDPAAPDLPVHHAGDGPGAPTQDEGPLETAFRLAADAFAQRRIAVDRLHVLTDDPRVFYTDTRDGRFNASSKIAPSVLRAYGAEQLNCAHAIFGYGAFGLGAGAPRANGVAAFADARGMGGCLARLDRLALKVGSLVPVADVLVRRSLEQDAGTYAALYIGGHSSQIVLANPRHGTVTVRVRPYGAMTLVETVARDSGIAIEEAAEALRSRLLTDDVPLVEPTGETAGILRSSMDRMIGPQIRRLLADLAETIDFFGSQRISGRPERLELFGAFDRLNGLAEFLAAGLSLPVEPSPATVLELFQSLPPEGALNLLQHSGPDLRIGQTSYRLGDGGRLTPLTDAERAQNRAEAVRQGARGRPPARASGRNRGRRPAGGGLPELQQLLARLRGRKPGDGGEEDIAAAPQADRQYFMLFGLFCALLALLAFQRFDEVSSAHANAMARMNQTVETNMRLRRAVITAERQPGAGAETDKVLWTEKFLAIGRNLDKPMWLTDVFLATETRTVGSSSVLSKKLVLEGAVLPSTVGHILEISKFIERLEKDVAGFMGDFREIRFHGASIDQAESDPIIRFGIEAWYDENKRLQTRTGGTAPGKGGALGDMQNKVRDHNQAIEAQAPVPAR